MTDQPATGADLYRVAAFLRELDRMLHPATVRPAGGYRLPPAILPPLPPTGSAGGGPAGQQGGTGWMTTRTPPPPAALMSPEIAWVEHPEHPEHRDEPGSPGEPVTPQPAPAAMPPVPFPVAGEVRSGTSGDVESPTPPARPLTRGPELSAAPTPAGQVVAAPPDPTPGRESPTPPTGPPTAKRPATAHRPAIAAPTEAVPPPSTGPPMAVPELATRRAPGPALPSIPAEERRAPNFSEVPQSLPTPSRRPVGPPVAVPARSPAATGNVPEEGSPPAATPPASPPAPEPVDLVVEGIDAALPRPENPAETPAVALDDDLLDVVARVPGPPPLPAGRGLRRTPAQLPADTADRVQASLQRLYLDRTLRRSR